MTKKKCFLFMLHPFCMVGWWVLVYLGHNNYGVHDLFYFSSFWDTNGQIHCWKGKGTRRDRGTAVFTIFHSSSDMKSPRLNFTLAYSCCNALHTEMFQCHYRCVPIPKAAWHELQGIHESWSTLSRTAWQESKI